MPEIQDDPEETRRRNYYYSQQHVGDTETELRTRAVWALIGMLAFAGAVIWFNHKYGEKILK